jgi:hypothetical protein
MDTQEKPKRKRGRPRKNPVQPPASDKPKRPRGRPRKTPAKAPVKQQLSHDQVMLLLKNYLKGVNNIKIDWDSIQRIHPNKYIYQVVVDKLSLKFIRQLEEIPLVEDVFFFSKVGSGVNGINLLFKVHIVFDVL